MAWVLETSGRSPGFLVGGILNNFDRPARLGSGAPFVVEGDEYDSAFFDKEAKFLHYRPQILVLNPVEFDHADIYRDLGHLLSAFRRLVGLVPPDGLIVAAADDPNVRALVTEARAPVVTFGLEPKRDLTAREIEWGGLTRFCLVQKGEPRGTLATPLLGRHNLQNALGVIAVALEMGIPLSAIQTAISEFRGVKRRQEVLFDAGGITVIDDFAHHPTAIRETLAALRLRYPERRLWALFEPRSNTTRRNVFQQEFPGSFREANRVLIAPVYSLKKIPPSERLDPGRIVRDLKEMGKDARAFESIDEMTTHLLSEVAPGDVVCLMSNGSFGGLPGRVCEGLAVVKPREVP